MLAELLVGISGSLLTEGRRRVAEAAGPTEAPRRADRAATSTSRSTTGR